MKLLVKFNGGHVGFDLEQVQSIFYHEEKGAVMVFYRHIGPPYTYDFGSPETNIEMVRIITEAWCGKEFMEHTVDGVHDINFMVN